MMFTIWSVVAKISNSHYVEIPIQNKYVQEKIKKNKLNMMLLSVLKNLIHPLKLANYK